MTSLVPVIGIKQRAPPKSAQSEVSYGTAVFIAVEHHFSTVFQWKIILMENQNTQPTLCRAGCGFYGNSTFDGMCSKCFKDFLRRTQSTSPTGRVSPAAASQPSVDEPSTSSVSKTTVTERTTEDRQPVVESGVDSIESIKPTVAEPDQEDSPSKTKRKNRCTTCRKKVGLTGFQCRCGGLFCSLHRYSDKHECTFDYKAEGQAEIRKNNPVVVRDKVQKI